LHYEKRSDLVFCLCGCGVFWFFTSWVVGWVGFLFWVGFWVVLVVGGGFLVHFYVVWVGCGSGGCWDLFVFKRKAVKE
jgi:hypothetical protein